MCGPWPALACFWAFLASAFLVPLSVLSTVPRVRPVKLRTLALTYLAPLLPLFEAEGKSYLTVAVGCTGGRHRSVFVAETVAKWLMARGLPVTVRHRELAKAAVPAIADAPLAERAETAKE